MVNPLLPLLEIKQKHALHCTAIVQSVRREAAEGRECAPLGARRDGSPTAAKRKKRKRKKRQAELPLVISGSRMNGSSVSDGMYRVRGRLPTPPPSHHLEFLASEGKPITVDIMTELLRHDYSPPLIAKFTELFRAVDKDRNRQLDLDETKEFMRGLYQATGTPMPSEDALQNEVGTIFESYDRDQNSVLDLGELIEYVRVSDLTRLMKTKWRPRIGDEELRLKRELAIKRLKERQAVAAHVKHVKAAVRLRSEWLLEQDVVIRGGVAKLEAAGRELLSLQFAEGNGRVAVEEKYTMSFVRQYSAFAMSDRQAWISRFIAKMKRIEAAFKEASIKLINAEVLIANARGKKLGAAAEALFNVIAAPTGMTLQATMSELQEASRKAAHFDSVLDKLGDAADDAELDAMPSFRADRGDGVLMYKRPIEIENLADCLEEYYNAKFPDGLDVIGEIASNLGRSHGEIMQLACCVYKKHRKKFILNSPTALLVMVLYTCEQRNIAQLLNVREQDIPTAIYWEINWALREGHKPNADQAHEALRKWVGFIAVLYTTKVNTDVSFQNKPLYRGLKNLPDEVVSMYLEKEIDDFLYWPAATSASADPKVLRDFTDEGNALVFEFHGWEEATQLWHVSAFPNEKELLLPPFTAFCVTAIDRDANRLYLHVRGNLGDGKTSKTNYDRNVDRRFAAWILRVLEDKSHEQMATNFLAGQVTRNEIRILPDRVMTDYSRILNDERIEWNKIIQTLSPPDKKPANVLAHAEGLWWYSNRSKQANDYMAMISEGRYGIDVHSVVRTILERTDDGHGGFGDFDPEPDEDEGDAASSNA